MCIPFRMCAIFRNSQQFAADFHGIAATSSLQKEMLFHLIQRKRNFCFPHSQKKKRILVNVKLSICFAY